MGPKEWGHLLKEALLVCITPQSKDLYRHRLFICHRCPIFNKELKICRPFPGSEHGCGCYVPYRALGEGPCWGRIYCNVGWV